MKKFKIGGVPEHFNAPWLYAIDHDLFKKVNLDIEFISYPTGTGAMCEALQAKELDLAVLLTEGAVSFISRGGNAEIIASYVNTPLNWGIHIAPDVTANTISDFKCATFAISRYGSGSHLMSYLLAKQQHWDLKTDLNFFEAGNLNHLCTALKQHQADIFLWEIFMTKEKVKCREIKCIGSIPTPWSAFMIAARQGIKAAFSEELNVLLQTLYKINHYFNTHHEVVNQFIQNKYQLALEDVDDWLKTVEWTTQLIFPIKEICQAEMFLKDANII